MIVRDDEYLDFSKVPESRGIPSSLVRVALAGIVIIFIIGGAVVTMSGYGHRWPAMTTVRVPLNNNP
ncbi:MAG TPA: hypothetical protein VMU38_08800 [Candidatus Binatia bacterium]|nr:hypothetical protein [Candidatus Binatia bacterium]